MRRHSQPKARPWRWLFFYFLVTLTCELTTHWIWLHSCRALMCRIGICPSSIWLVLSMTALALPIPYWHLRHGLFKHTSARDSRSAQRFALLYFACSAAGILSATLVFGYLLDIDSRKQRFVEHFDETEESLKHLHTPVGLQQDKPARRAAVLKPIPALASPL